MRQPAAPKATAAPAKARTPVSERQIARESQAIPSRPATAKSIGANQARAKVSPVAQTQAVTKVKPLWVSGSQPIVDKAKVKEIKAERKAIKADLKVEKKSASRRRGDQGEVVTVPGPKGKSIEKLATVTQLAPRIAEKEARERSGKAQRIFKRLMATAMVLGLGWLIGFSNYLALDPEQIVVSAEDGSLVDLGAVANLAAPYHRKPLARVRLSNLEQQVRDLPAVKEVDVMRTWPNGLTFEIESRVPAGAVASENGFSWIDAAGVVVGEFDNPGDLPKLEAPLDQPRVLADLIVVWRELPPELKEMSRSLSASTPDDITTTLRSGQVIRWGSVEQIKLKIATAEALLATAPKSPVFDVSSPALPVTR